MLFIDFSSAFNAIPPHLLIKRLLDLGANCALVLWIRQFLCDGPQSVSLSGTSSDELIENTGAPQGCFLAHNYYFLYTLMK